MIRGFVITGLLIAASATAAPKAREIDALRALSAQDARLATIGYRLAKANTPFCKTLARNPGWVLHGIGQYPDDAAARAAFGFDYGSISIAAIVPDGPAAKAGLHAGDGIANLRDSRWDNPMPVLPRPTKNDAELFRKALFYKWANELPVEFSVVNAGAPKSLMLTPPAICASDFWVDTRGKIDAGADGERVRLTSAMMDYVPDDHELAAVVAHELAHNLLGHRPKLASVKKGKTNAIFATEVEADQLSVWLMANAGFDTQAALRFTERYGRQYGLGLFSAGTHPRWKKRITSMQDELRRIAATPVENDLRDPPLLMDFRTQQ